MADEIDFVSDLNTGDNNTAESADGAIPAHSKDVLQAQVPAKVPAAPKEDTGESGDTPKKPLSLRDQISSALKGEEITPDVALKDGGQARNPDGTFAARTTQVATPSGQPTPVEGGQGQIDTPPGLDPVMFKALPAETQDTLARTMAGIYAAQQRFAVLDQVEQLIAPRRQAWALNGMSEHTALSQLLALSDFAGRDPGGFIMYMAENSGVNLEDLVTAKAQVDPGIAAMQAEISALKQQLMGFDTQQQQAAHTATVNEVIAFASEKGQDGQPLRPYFDELGSGVLPFIEAVRNQNPSWSKAQILQAAYENACWGIPAIRAKMQASAGAVGEAERLRTQADRVNKAKAAGVSVRNGAPSAPASAPADAKRSLRDTIKASMASQT